MFDAHTRVIRVGAPRLTKDRKDDIAPKKFQFRERFYKKTRLLPEGDVIQGATLLQRTRRSTRALIP
jgi:hypothetical protein